MGESSSPSLLMYTQLMGLERHGRVRGFGYGATPTLVFGVTFKKKKKKEAHADFASKLKETKEDLSILKNVKNKNTQEIQLQ